MNTGRVWNFAAGPSVLPEAVLKRAQKEMLNWNGSGMSVMEMSHRSAMFTQIFDHAQSSFRTLMHIPSDYHVLFLQGGASICTAEEGRNTLRMVLACYLSAREGCRVRIDDERVYEF